MALADRVAALDHAALAPVTSALFARAVPVRSITAEAIGYRATNPVSAGLVRVRGTAEVAGHDAPWSAVLKVLRPLSDEDVARFRADPARMREAYRWDREAEAYASGFVAALSGGLTAPRLLHLERRDDEAWLWLEDVVEDVRRWDVARYALAARHLGRFNGAFASSLPEWPWLSRGWLRSWIGDTTSRSREILDEEAVWRRPVVRDALGADALADLRRIVARRYEDVDLLDRLPQCVAHLDAFRGNLLSRRRGATIETVAIDWSFVGITALGVESGHLVSASVFFHGDRVPVDDLDRAVFAAYVAGLRDVGWSGDEALVRVGHLIGPVLRFATIGLGALRAVDDHAQRRGVEERQGIPFADVLEALARRLDYVRRCAQEATSLAASVAQLPG